MPPTEVVSAITDAALGHPDFPGQDEGYTQAVACAVRFAVNGSIRDFGEIVAFDTSMSGGTARFRLKHSGRDSWEPYEMAYPPYGPVDGSE